jgi:hypothetical protein
MIAHEPVEIDALAPLQAVSVTVRIRNGWRLRLGLVLLGLAARVLRCRVDVFRRVDDARG